MDVKEGRDTAHIEKCFARGSPSDLEGVRCYMDRSDTFVEDARCPPSGHIPNGPDYEAWRKVWPRGKTVNRTRALVSEGTI